MSALLARTRSEANRLKLVGVGWLLLVGAEVIAWVFDWPIPPWHAQVLLVTVLVAASGADPTFVAREKKETSRVLSPPSSAGAPSSGRFASFR